MTARGQMRQNEAERTAVQLPHEYLRAAQGWWKPGMSPRVLTSDNMILDLAKKGELTATTTAFIVNATVVSTP